MVYRRRIDILQRAAIEDQVRCRIAGGADRAVRAAVGQGGRGREGQRLHARSGRRTTNIDVVIGRINSRDDGAGRDTRSGSHFVQPRDRSS